MFQPEKVKGIIFDYGGTIDSNGLHWAEVIWNAYREAAVPVDYAPFRDAYVHGERTLGRNPIVQPHHNFRDMLALKIRLQTEWLVENGHLDAAHATPQTVDALTDATYRFARQSVEAARPLLEALHSRYPLVLVSNFYGNIETVLKDFRLDGYFSSIIESAVVGIRKPDPAIFRLGLEKLGLDARAVVVIGDSYDKDIVPATTLHCQTIWLKNIGWAPYTGQETADAVITDFRDLANCFFPTK